MKMDLTLILTPEEAKKYAPVVIFERDTGQPSLHVHRGCRQDVRLGEHVKRKYGYQ